MYSEVINNNDSSTYELNIFEFQKAEVIISCVRCGRPLTNPYSRTARIGPKCARKLAYELRNRKSTLKNMNFSQLSVNQSFFSQEYCFSIQKISLYYQQNKSLQPCCKLGILKLPAKYTSISNRYGYYKKIFALPLIESMVYQVFELLPQPHIFWLQVQHNQLKDITNFSK